MWFSCGSLLNFNESLDLDWVFLITSIVQLLLPTSRVESREKAGYKQILMVLISVDVTIEVRLHVNYTLHL